MTLFKVSKEGQKVVERDASTGRIQRGVPLPAPTPLKTTARKENETWRSVIRRLTNGGKEMYVTLLNISRGLPHSVPMPHLGPGAMSEPVVPTPEVRLQATKALIEFVDGKAVAQTEVLAAEKEAEAVEQYAAMSDDDLRRIAGVIDVRFKELPPEKEEG